MNYIDDDLVSEAITYKKANKRQWAKWTSLAACLCVLVLGAVVWKIVETNLPPHGAGTLPGDTEVYPTVMVDGKFYEWSGIRYAVPEDCVYYGQVIHVGKNRPMNDCEFRAIFDASGDIYICPSDGCVYICMTTDWMEDTFVAFDSKETE